jgi:hypothetical protein
MKSQEKKFEIYEQAIVEEQEQTVVATLTNDTVLRRTIPWDTMKSAKLISEGELAMIRKFDKRPSQEREDLLDKVRQPPPRPSPAHCSVLDRRMLWNSYSFVFNSHCAPVSLLATIQLELARRVTSTLSSSSTSSPT